jgi:hypothetical protein
MRAVARCKSADGSGINLRSSCTSDDQMKDQQSWPRAATMWGTKVAVDAVWAPAQWASARANKVGSNVSLAAATAGPNGESWTAFVNGLASGQREVEREVMKRRKPR